MPFTLEQFFEVFRQYNLAVFPAQIVLYVFAVASCFLVFVRGELADRGIFLILAIFWLWTGVVYHILHFAQVNTAAYLFGGLFVIQGFLFLYAAVHSSFPSLEFRSDLRGLFGAGFIVYAMLIYPALGYLLGHIYPAAPTFGVPCPTAIFTFGVLLFVRTRLSFYFYMIPLIWSMIGASAAFYFGVLEDIGLFVAGILGSFLLFTKR